ncbi:Demethyldecarbamoylnovobiocin O-methyltransferase [subsurface metagenome]
MKFLQMMIHPIMIIKTLRSISIKDFFKIHKIKLILTVKSHTLLGYLKLLNLYEIASSLEREKIDGGFVECGGSAGIIASVAKHNKNRHIWLFDSWEGQPEPTEYDVSSGKQAKKGMFLSSEEKAKELIFKKLGLNDNRVRLVKGWFNDTIPSQKKKIGKIALLHIDCDWYESVKFCLEKLYNNVVKNGFIIIDDYEYWEGCKKAVDEFIEKRNLRVELIKTDYTDHSEVYFKKP